MNKKLSVIIPAYNEFAMIGRLVRTLGQWVRKPEIIVVANGCTDGTAARARNNGAIVVDLPMIVGPDVGRSIGAHVASGDTLVFVDGDMLVSPQELEPFVRAVEQGVDIALNQYPLPQSRWFLQPTAIAKQALNLFLDRPDLQAASLTAVPHAMSRRAVETLGASDLRIPPVALTRAVLAGLKVSAVTHVPVGFRNPSRRRPAGASYWRLIIGDYLEAVHVLQETLGDRGAFPDNVRRRSALSALDPRPDELDEYDSLAVIPVCNEKTTLPPILDMLKNGPVAASYVISNGSRDGTPDVAEAHGAIVKTFDERLGHDVGRAVGCLTLAADKYLFLDGDILIRREDLMPFVDALEEVDVALNDIDPLLRDHHRLDGVSIAKWFLNLALDRPDLRTASLTAVPHAMRGSVLSQINPETLAVPPLAHTKAVMAGFQVKAVHSVDVISQNRFRRDLHSRDFGRPLERLILGDHLEALAHLQTMAGPRAFYPDTLRRRELALSWRHYATIKYPGKVRY